MSTYTEAESADVERRIIELVRVFYERARAHPDLGPVFARAVHDWDRHLVVVQDFWSHVLLGTERYRGSPYPLHTGLAIQREHFEPWLRLFREAAAAALAPAEAAKVLAKAEHMEEGFRAGLFPFDPIRQRSA